MGRGEAFDPKANPIVRIQVRRLRARLERYYAAEGRHDPIRIEIPKGCYVPDFRERPDDDPVACSRPLHLDPGPKKWSIRSTFGLLIAGTLLLATALFWRASRTISSVPGATSARFSNGQPLDLDVYRLNLRARYLLSRGGVTQATEACALFRQVIAKDASFAPAYSGLAGCYRALLVLETMPPREIVPEINTAALKAFELDHNSAEAHASLATVLAWKWKPREAEEEYRRAVQLVPNEPGAHGAYAISLAASGRFEQALRHAQRAVDLDPLSPHRHVTKGVVLYWARRYDRSLEEGQRALELSSTYSMAHHLLGAVYLETGLNGEAVAEFEKAAELSGGGTFDRGFQGYAYGRTGDAERARQILRQLLVKSQQEYVAPLGLALVYLGLGDRGHALTWIENAYVEGSSQWPYYLAAPLYDPLRSEARFRRVLEKIGLF